MKNMQNVTRITINIAIILLTIIFTFLDIFLFKITIIPMINSNIDAIIDNICAPVIPCESSGSIGGTTLFNVDGGP